ncbi:MAG: hypothetical protein IPO90_04750 [Flavobacteriales bacterium]|nr:hypothetical protein [Flavobacteriales bacterium]
MINRSLFLLIVMLGPKWLFGQGCSDAGVCTAGPTGQLHLWQDSTADVVDYRHMARLGFSYAVGEQSTTIMQLNPEISIGIGPKLSVAFKIPYVFTSGKLGNNSGLGDAIITTSFAFIKEEDRNLTGVLGVRLPTGTTDAEWDGVSTQLQARSLPMPYQTGLGTTDLLAAINWRYKRYVASIAYQHVLVNDNMNGFSHYAWNNDPSILGYFESNMLDRGDDLVARVQYAYGCGRLSLQPGLLGIYHLQEDTRVNDAATMSEMGNERITLTGSQGLTLNLTADLRYKLAEQWAIEATFGTPLITREVRPDGLTRSLVIGFGLRYRF